MVHLMSIANLVAIDFAAEAKVPCWVTEFDYFARVKVAMAAPVVVVGLIVAICILTLSYSIVSTPHSHTRRLGANQPHHGYCERGLWMAAPIALLALDLIYPAVSRTLLQFFTCRDLGQSSAIDATGEDAGRWLEADYSLSRFCRALLL